jgi:hypothetical protein
MSSPTHKGAKSEFHWGKLESGVYTVPVTHCAREVEVQFTIQPSCKVSHDEGGDEGVGGRVRCHSY